jgi:hypothetical protein
MTTRESLVRALIIAGLFLGSSLALRLLSPDHLSADLARRWLGVLTGLVLVVYANALPKELSPLARMRCDPAAEQAMRRFAGWALTLGGGAYAMAWLVAPLDRANPIAVGLLGTSLVLVVGRLTWSIARKSRA